MIQTDISIKSILFFNVFINLLYNVIYLRHFNILFSYGNTMF